MEGRKAWTQVRRGSSRSLSPGESAGRDASAGNDDRDVNMQMALPLRPRSSSPRPAQSHESEAIEQLRIWLRARGFGEEDEISDGYLETVLNATKNGKKRSFEYAALKIEKSLKWRRECAPDAITWTQVSRAMAPNHMWWEGQDRLGRPILYVRPGLMDLGTYCREEYVQAHIYLLEQGLRRMGAGVSSFVLIVDASALGAKHMDLARDKQVGERKMREGVETWDEAEKKHWRLRKHVA